LKYVFPLVLLLFFQSPFLAQNEFALSQKRAEFRVELERKIDNALIDFLDAELTDNLDEAFWGSGLLIRKNDNLFNTLSILFSENNILPEVQLRAALECAFTVYPAEFTDLLYKKVHKISHPKIFSMIVVYLVRNGLQFGELLEITDNYIRRTGTDDHPLLQGLLSFLKKENPLTLNETEILLNYEYKQNIIFSVQYKNRDKAGFVLIKEQGGGFLRDSSGATVIIPQMARSLSNLPGFLTNGNTPQGIFTIIGVDTSENVFIGFTPNLQLALPFEVAPDVFFRTSAEETRVMQKTNYLSILPPNLRTKWAFLEAFFAGKAGRNEIIAHGTATDITYYKNEVYFPYTPTLGCLCMREEWSGETGELIYSDQQRFMKLIFEHSVTNGFFIVAEVEDNITPAMIQKLLK